MALFPRRTKLGYVEIERAVFPERAEVPNHLPDGLVVMADGNAWDPALSGPGLVAYNEAAARFSPLGELFRVGLTLTSAQMLALFATPRTLAPAVAGYAWIPLETEAFLDYNSAAYAGIAANEDIVLRYTNAAGGILTTIETTGFLDQTSDQRRYVVNSGTVTPLANAAVVAHMTTGEITTGNSPVTIRSLMRLVKLA